MKLSFAAIISTTIVVIIGLILISPMYLPTQTTANNPKLMLAFSISDSVDVIEWCQNLSNILKNHSMEATAFFTGKVAEKNPECVTIFSDEIDIGSQTYSNTNLTSINDYSIQLEEIKKGKNAVDIAGNLDTKSFKAPFGATDQNIYSLLSKNGILADFSYENQYNIYQNNQFIKIEIESFQYSEIPSELFSKTNEQTKPIILYLNNNIPIYEIEKLIQQIEESSFETVSASNLVGINLTIRGDM